MISSLELKKNKNKANQFNLNQKNADFYLQNNPINPQSQYSMFNKNSINSQKRARNASSGTNIIKKGYNIKKNGSQYNLINKINNQLENDNIKIINDNNSIKSPEEYTRNKNIVNNNSNKLKLKKSNT